jgi:long-chain acyl-CoA synthetase
MLYQRWQKIARERARETALFDYTVGRRWTFAELAAAAADSPEPSEPVLFPQGNNGDFVLALLRAWRWGKAACPLEASQTAPNLSAPPTGCAHLKLTSATTGSARMVAFTGAQLAADADNIVSSMGLKADWPNLAAISMAHSYGLSNLVTPLLLHGIPLIIAPSPLPEMLRQVAADFREITLPGVPALWRNWLEAGAIPRNVRLAISAGAPLSVALEQRVFAETGVKIHNLYGASECGSIAYDRSVMPRTDDSYVGEPLDNVEVSLGESGCLRVRGAAVAQTYWPHPGDALKDGAFQTTDLAEIRDGLVHLRGRISDEMNVAGRKVAPGTIEQALAGHPGVKECLVFGAPSPEADRAEVIVACVAAKSAVKAEELRQYLLARLPAWQVPREWWFLESLTVNERGKISRAEWKKKYLEKVLRAM